MTTVFHGILIHVSWDSKGYPELRMEISACVYFYIVLPRMFMAYLHICCES